MRGGFHFIPLREPPGTPASPEIIPIAVHEIGNTMEDGDILIVAGDPGTFEGSSPSAWSAAARQLEPQTSSENTLIAEKRPYHLDQDERSPIGLTFDTPHFFLGIDYQ